MMMRYRGGGVGHTATRALTNTLLRDRHPSDTIFDPESIDDLSPEESTGNDDNDTSSEQSARGSSESGNSDEDNLDHDLGDTQYQEEQDYGYITPEEEEFDDEDNSSGAEHDGSDADDALGAEDGEVDSDFDSDSYVANL